jgi:ornithine cyclodeaminase/alanine dehydrogenase-like protein (mu-crystallin family)
VPLLIDRATVRSLFTMPEAIDAARAAFLALAGDRVTMPQRLAVRVPEEHGTQLTMPCYVAGDGGILAVKVATVFERNVERFGMPTTLAFLALQDARSGALLALMDGEHLTAMRTAAASALATDLLAVADARVLAVIGAGAQAEAHVEAMRAVRPIDEVRVFSRDNERRTEFAGRVNGIAAASAADAVRGAQIVCTATNSTTPVFSADDLSPSTHINAVGSFRADMRELDVETVRRARVFVDRREAARNGAGELIAAVQEGALTWDGLAGELGELLTMQVPGRQGNEITVYKSVGLSVQDAFAAARVHELAVEQGLGVPFRLD